MIKSHRRDRFNGGAMVINMHLSRQLSNSVSGRLWRDLHDELFDRSVSDLLCDIELELEGGE